MKSISIIAVLFLSSCSLLVHVPNIKENQYTINSELESITFKKKDHYFHLFNFNIASDESDLLFYVDMPGESGVYEANEIDVFLADFRGCETKKNGVSLFRGNDVGIKECDGEPPLISAIKKSGRVYIRYHNRSLASYSIIIESIQFNVSGKLIEFSDLKVGVKKVPYYGP